MKLAARTSQRLNPRTMRAIATSASETARTPSDTIIRIRRSCLSAMVPPNRLKLTRATVKATPVNAMSTDECVLV